MPGPEAIGGGSREEVLGPNMEGSLLLRPMWREPLLWLVMAVFIAAAAMAALYFGHDAGQAPAAAGMAALLSGILAAVGLLSLLWLVRRAHQAELQAAMLQHASDSIPDPSLVVDSRGQAILTNHAFREIARTEGGEGSALEQLRRHLCTDPEAVREFRRLEKAAAAGRRATAEICRQCPDGRREWFDVSVLPLPSLPGGTAWRLIDVTARRQMLEVIREEQGKLSDFLEHAPLGFYSVNERGRFLFVNQTLASWLGTTPAEMVQGGWRLHDILAEPVPPGTPAHVPFADGDDAGPGELFLRGAAGEPFQAHVSQSVVIDPERRSIRTRSVVRDLRPERQWEQALRASEQRFQRLFEQAPIGVALLDDRQVIRESNPAFGLLVGRAAAALAGFPLSALLSDREDLAAKLRQVAAGEAVRMPLEVRLAGPGDRACALFARPIDTGGRDAGLVVHLIETSEQKKLELQFAQSQKMLAVGQLAGGIAHDFNNLLTAMIGFCDLLLLKHQPGDSSFSDIMQIKQNANRAANLVRQLLAFSRQQTLQPRVLNLTDVLADLSNLLRRLIGASIELRMQHGRDLGLVKVDQVQLEQVIMNLAVNGRDAMPNGGTLTIRTSNVTVEAPRELGRETMLPGDYVLIEVTDTGVGIPRENLDRIFEPFFSTKEVGSGTGLGLSTVYGIVKQTDGYISVESEPGKGAAFSIYLPVYRGEIDAEGGRSEAGRASADLTGAGTVLLVEDEDPVRLFSARALRNKGYRVLEARSGEAALELLDSERARPDILITDVIMPRMDGPTLIAKVRERWPELKIICISGYAEGSFREKLGRYKDIHFLPKPFSLQQLAGKVKEAMSGE